MHDQNSPAEILWTHFKLGNCTPAVSSFEKFQEKQTRTSISSGSPSSVASGRSSVDERNNNNNNNNNNNKKEDF